MPHRINDMTSHHAVSYQITSITPYLALELIDVSDLRPHVPAPGRVIHSLQDVVQNRQRLVQLPLLFVDDAHSEPNLFDRERVDNAHFLALGGRYQNSKTPGFFTLMVSLLSYNLFQKKTTGRTRKESIDGCCAKKAHIKTQPKHRPRDPARSSGPFLGTRRRPRSRGRNCRSNHTVGLFHTKVARPVCK